MKKLFVVYDLWFVCGGKEKVGNHRI